MPAIQTLWEQIDRRFRTKALSVWDPSSSMGASEEEIAHAEAVLGVTFPDDFRASYRIHNGGCPFPPWKEGLMPLNGIVGIWQMFSEHRDQGYIEDFPDEPQGPVQPSHWLPKWIPFAWGGYGGEYACLDLDPGPGGRVGQIVLRTHESEPAKLLAPSFEVWLATFARDLKARRYVLDQGNLVRKVPITQRLSGALERKKQLLFRYKTIIDFFRQNPKLAFSFFMSNVVKARARDLWLLFRDCLRTRWVRGLAWPVQTALWSADGAHIVTGLNSQIQLWDAHSGDLLRTIKVPAGCERVVAWSPDGKHLLLTDAERSIQSIQVLDGTPVSTYTFPAQNASVSPRNYEPVTSVAWSPSGEQIAAGSLQGNVYIWDALNNVLLAIYSWYTWTVYALAFSPDGTRLASRGSDNTVRIWSADGSRPLWTFSGHGINSFAWSPDSKCLAIGSWEGVRIIDAADGHVISTYDYHRVRSVAFSPDGKFLALGDSIDGLIQIIAVADGHCIGTYHRHMLNRNWLFPNKDARDIYALAFSPDGRSIVSGASNRTLCVWRAHLWPR